MVSSRHKKVIIMILTMIIMMAMIMTTTMTTMIMMGMRPVKAMVLRRHRKMTKLCNFHSALKPGNFCIK